MPRARDSRPSPSTPRPIANRCTCDSPTTTSASGRRRHGTPTSASRAIIAAAEITGADAIHPGYGFLAENAEFADTCGASNITFIGPTGEQIRLMGDKAAARRLAKEARRADRPGFGRACSPTPTRPSTSPRRSAFPVIIKAAAGGGGKGMRVANDEEQFAQLVSRSRRTRRSRPSATATSTSRSTSRGRATSRFQVLGDSHGRVIHLGERDCSVQRRHQKLIEESPSPGARRRAPRPRWASRAVKLAAAIDYVGAGTIELLLDQDGWFYFMEMNTRIQVEHPVTEMVTGFDLVKEQIRVAAGEPLSIPHGDFSRLRGHAIECRVNAEDPYRNFQPSPRTHHRVSSARRAGRARGHPRLRRLHGAAVLRFAAGQAHRARSRSRPRRWREWDRRSTASSSRASPPRFRSSRA